MDEWTNERKEGGRGLARCLLSGGGVRFDAGWDDVSQQRSSPPATPRSLSPTTHTQYKSHDSMWSIVKETARYYRSLALPPTDRTHA